jgi:hypothetical protein
MMSEVLYTCRCCRLSVVRREIGEVVPGYVAPTPAVKRWPLTPPMLDSGGSPWCPECWDGPNAKQERRRAKYLALIEHPDTPSTERAVARLRLREIDRNYIEPEPPRPIASAVPRAKAFDASLLGAAGFVFLIFGILTKVAAPFHSTMGMGLTIVGAWASFRNSRKRPVDRSEIQRACFMCLWISIISWVASFIEPAVFQLGRAS